MQFPSNMQHKKLPQFALALLVVGLLLPFLDKAYHLDDPVYLWVARQILHKPLDFFGFYANWYREIQPFARISVSPPLYSYYLAMVGALFGWGEVPMHLASLLPAVAVALGTYQLAARLDSPPFTAALLTVCTPIFLVSGSSIMVDMAMTACYVWALNFWISGLEESPRSRLHLTFAALLVVAAGLTKYFGISLIPLMAVYALWQRKPLWRWLPFLLAPLVVFALYQYWTKQLYGFGHITHASEFAAAFKQKLKASTLRSMSEGLSFAGGGALIPLAFAPFLLPRRILLPSAAALLALSLLSKMAGLYEHLTSWVFHVQFVFFIAAGVAIIFTAIQDFRKGWNAGSLLLLCWIMGVFLFCTALNPFIAGRYMLPFAPAVAIMFAKRLRMDFTGWKQATFIPSLVLMLGISLAVTNADYRYANAVRSAAKDILQVWPKYGGQLFFMGHWGLQYYLEAGGGVAMSQSVPMVKDGDLVVWPSFSSNVVQLNPESYTVLETLTILPVKSLSAFSGWIGAGFHSSLLGPLPFAFGAIKPDSFSIVRIKSTGTHN